MSREKKPITAQWGVSTIHYVATDKLAAVRERAALNKSNLTPSPQHPSQLLFLLLLLHPHPPLHVCRPCVLPSKSLQDAFTPQPFTLHTPQMFLKGTRWQKAPCKCAVVHGFCCSEIALMPLIRMSQSMGQLLAFCSLMGKDFLDTSILIKRRFAHLTTKRFFIKYKEKKKCFTMCTISTY